MQRITKAYGSKTAAELWFKDVRGRYNENNQGNHFRETNTRGHVSSLECRRSEQRGIIILDQPKTRDQVPTLMRITRMWIIHPENDLALMGIISDLRMKPGHHIDSNTLFKYIIPYDQYVEDNEEHVVQSNVSSVRNDALMSILDEMLYMKQGCNKIKVAKQVQPALYNGHVLVMSNHARPIVHDSEVTREIAEITRKIMLLKMQSPLCLENKVRIAPPPDYSKENLLATFAPQRNLTPEQIFWSIDDNARKKAKTSVPKPISTLTVNVETVREIVEEARVVKPLDNALNYACQYTKLSQELLEHVIGTCPKSFNERDNKAPSTPVTRKKQVTFSDKPGTSLAKHLRTRKSKPRSNTKKNRILPAKRENKKKVEDHLRTNNRFWKPKGKLSDNSLNKTKQVWKATGKLFADIGYQWRPTGKKFTLGKLDCGYQWRSTGEKFALGEMCPLTKLSVKCSTLSANQQIDTCFVRDINGADLLKGSHSTNLYTISIDDMMNSSPICLLSKASKSKSWLWHRRLNHLNFACQLGKSKKFSHKPKSENTNMEVLHTLHMDLCGPIYIRTDNGSEFVNQVIFEYYEGVGVFHQKSVPRTPQQNGVVKRRNHTLVEAARTMIIFSKAPMFLWEKAVATACTPNAPILQSASSSTSDMHHPVRHQGIAEEPTLEDSLITHDVLHPSFNPVTGEPGSAQSSSGNMRICGMSRFKKMYVGNCQFLGDRLNTMAKQNVPAQPPTRTDEQIVYPRSQWVNNRRNMPSLLFLNAQKIQKDTHLSDIVDHLEYYKRLLEAFSASAKVFTAIYMQQFWNTMKYDEKALAITSVIPAHPFELPPSGNTVIDFVNELGYPEPVEICLKYTAVENYVYNHGGPNSNLNQPVFDREMDLSGSEQTQDTRSAKCCGESSLKLC
ncbi:retrovirus-related pol polyprotein from transposon TNT 1-94 [Tanacetum coccineum]|uniref:Retrovirus-related pol polyprotein from transposon TNT 1-94 n=1 Tax=Tanacetum coccineum TaxID=301880 RepID=A0ABQ5E8K6_9ASTR